LILVSQSRGASLGMLLEDFRMILPLHAKIWLLMLAASSSNCIKEQQKQFHIDGK
jgi:hypothetical protein